MAATVFSMLPFISANFNDVQVSLLKTYLQ